MKAFIDKKNDGPGLWSEIPPGIADIRLIAVDMDGTLLPPDGQIPGALWPLLRQLTERGITFVPASGRQYATLAAMFPDAGASLSFIAENGNLVVHAGKVISSDNLEFSVVREVIDTVRSSERNLGLVVCGVASAYIESADAQFVAEARKYYAELETVRDLTDVRDEVLKLAIFDRDDAATTADTVLNRIANSHQVVVSGKHWVDIMTPWADKGRALRSLQRQLGVSQAQTVAFGDYLNDLELLEEADWSFAMANAHPDIKAAARFLAPSNTDNGVISVLQHLLNL